MWSPLRDYNYPVHRLLERAARRHLAAFAGRVLDVGCGTGPYRDLLPPGARYVGIDATASGATSLLASVAALPFADATFDGVLCTEVLEYSRRPEAALAEMRRVLRPDGALYMTTPFDWHVMDGPDYWRFTPAGLRLLLADGGFADVQVEEVGGIFSSTMGKLLEEGVQRVWLPAARALGVRRGAYFAAALGALPWNAASLALAPVLDRLSTRNPFALAVLARRP